MNMEIRHALAVQSNILKEMTMNHFTMFTEKPTDAFLKAIETAGITVRGWEIPAHKFRARKTSRNTLKVEGRGWVDPNDKVGNLKLSVNGNREGVYATKQDPQVMAFKSVLTLAGIHGVYAANGGMKTDA